MTAAEPVKMQEVVAQQLIHGFACLHDQLLSMIKGSKLSNAEEDYHLQ